jgi:ubiquinone biosynthesis monooxygenase Coq7
MIAFPPDMLPDLRSDHAGESGAVTIYRTILKVNGDPGLKEFAERHLSSEIRHLDELAVLVSETDRSRLVFLWRIGGAVLTRITAFFGPRWVYGVVAAVEDGVDRHYQLQLDKLAERPEYRDLAGLLESFRQEEIIHRDEAAARCGVPGFWLSLWCGMFGLGSGMLTAVTRKI